MPVAERMHLTEKTEIVIGRKRPRFFIVPREKAQGVAQILKDYEVETADAALIPAKEVLPDLADHARRPGVVLRGFRLRDHLTQVELAHRLGCPQPWISQMESGARPIGRKMAARVGKVFRADPRVFL